MGGGRANKEPQGANKEVWYPSVQLADYNIYLFYNQAVTFVKSCKKWSKYYLIVCIFVDMNSSYVITKECLKCNFNVKA